MSAGDEQCDEWKFRRGVGKQRREQVPFQVMNADGGNVQCIGQCAGNAGADQQGAGKTGALRVGDGIDVIECASGFLQ